MIAAAEKVEYVPATGMLSALWLLLALPAAGAAILLLAGKRSAKGWGPYLAMRADRRGVRLGLVAFFALRGEDEAARQVDLHLFSWIPVGGFQVDAGLLFDPLSATFVLLITGVGFLIHVYSLGYMEHDPRKKTFFAYLNLFVAAMLLLVLGNSFLALYVGWEGVGLASYLLIAFWFYKPEAATAAKKAFIANRVGDVGLSLAIMVMFAALGTTTYAGVFTSRASPAARRPRSGCCCCSAPAASPGQFPLQTWLPGRDGGPDPGLGPHPRRDHGHRRRLPDRPLDAGLRWPRRTRSCVVTIIGAVTLMIGCLIGCAYDDIKKVLAYSTVSQIGYMFLAVGIPGAGRDRDPAPADPRLLQGLHVPVRRIGHARHGRPGRHAPLRRAAQGHAGHLRLLPHRLPRDHRPPAVRRLLLEGQDHRVGLRPRAARAATSSARWPCSAPASPPST